MPWRHLNCGRPQRTETVYSDTWSAHQEQKPHSLSSSVILLLLCLHQHCTIFPEVFCLIVHYRTFPRDPSPLQGITQTESLLVRIFESEKAVALQYSCLENPKDGGAWWAAVHGVVKTRTQLSDFTFTFHFHALEKEMATHSSVLAWRIPGTAEPGRLPSVGSHRVRQDWSDLAAAAA